MGMLLPHELFHYLYAYREGHLFFQFLTGLPGASWQPCCEACACARTSSAIGRTTVTFAVSFKRRSHRSDLTSSLFSEKICRILTFDAAFRSGSMGTLQMRKDWFKVCV